jgi:catechol 2,3-dioxygenase-like lactoylglutathione lyase family enzyme
MSGPATGGGPRLSAAVTDNHLDDERRTAMTSGGYNHIGLATLDIAATKEFYETTLGFTTVRFDRFDIAEGGFMRHLFMDTGNGEMISFLEPNETGRIGAFDAGINKGLGVPNGFYHLAFEAGSLDGLEEIRRRLGECGVKVSPVIDHDWAKSIYFFDPVNNLSLEYCTLTREFNEDDRTFQYRFTAPFDVLEIDVDSLVAGEKSQMDNLATQ